MVKEKVGALETKIDNVERNLSAKIDNIEQKIDGKVEIQDKKIGFQDEKFAEQNRRYDAFFSNFANLASIFVPAHKIEQLQITTPSWPPLL